MSYSYQRNDTLYNGTSEVPNAPGVRTTFQQQTAHVSYAAARWLNLNAVIPRVDIHRRATGVPDLNIHGIGDTAFYAQLHPFRIKAAESEPSGVRKALDGLSLIIGMETPTGEDSGTPVIGAATPSLLQAGSGTWDPIVGVECELRKGNLVAYHQSTAILRIGESSAGLNPGDALIVVTGVGYRVADRVLPTLSVDTILRGSESIRGAAIANTGAALTFLTPGVSVKLRENIALEGSARIPIHRSVVATQLTPGIRWRIGLVVRF